MIHHPSSDALHLCRDLLFASEVQNGEWGTGIPRLLGTLDSVAYFPILLDKASLRGVSPPKMACGHLRTPEPFSRAAGSGITAGTGFPNPT